MVPSWLAHNPRASRTLRFGRDQQYVVNPNGIPELCEDLKQCPRHSPTPLHALPGLADRLGNVIAGRLIDAGTNEIRKKIKIPGFPY